MSSLKLYIGNKNYSSWSFRPWLLMCVKEIDFEEELARFDFLKENAHFLEFSPTKQVPCLHHGDLIIPGSLAIIEYMADLYPDKGIWPDNLEQRALARAYAQEMLAGFHGLRSECPMNMRRPVGSIDISQATRQNIKRVEDIWKTCLERSGGPFLFGEFSAVDAMFAPVVNRLEIYALSDHPAVLTYKEAMKALPQWLEWEEAGKAEPWIVEEDELNSTGL